VDTTKTRQPRLGMASGERNVDGGVQIQLEKDGGGGTRQSWTVDYDPLGGTRKSWTGTSGLWTMIHWEGQDRAGRGQVVCGL